LIYERDQNFDKCKHAIKILLEVTDTKGTTQATQYTLGYLPTDISYSMALLIDENKGYFLVSVGFARSCESHSPGALIA
jgi:hypothetical protein